MFKFELKFASTSYQLFQAGTRIDLGVGVVSKARSYRRKPFFHQPPSRYPFRCGDCKSFPARQPTRGPLESSKLPYFHRSIVPRPFYYPSALDRNNDQ